MSGTGAAPVRAERPCAERDFNISPMIVFYEVTRACDLVCLHCRACAAGAGRPERAVQRAFPSAHRPDRELSRSADAGLDRWRSAQACGTSTT